MTDTTIHELETEAGWRDAFGVLGQLRPDFDEDTFVAAVTEMADDGYRLFARSVDDEIVTVAGVVERVNLYDGHHLWVHDLVTDDDHRSEGHGLALLSYLEDWAEQQGCERLCLSSGVQRKDAHRFYEERAGMERASSVYKQPLG